jgi:hypothetical protein
MELYGLLPYLREPATGPYPEPEESNAHICLIFLYYSVLYCQIFVVSSFLQILL